MAKSRAAAMLEEKILTIADVARKVGVSRQTVWSWLNGKTLPGPEYMRKLEDACDIPMRAWTDPVDATADEPAPTREVG